MDSSWGRAGNGGATGAVRPTDRADRERLRSEERRRRADERIAATQARAEDRTAARVAADREREQDRASRTLEETARRSARVADVGKDDGLTIAKRRPSGAKSRTGEVRIERDTRHYQTLVDIGRIRELAKRGASIAGLASAFGISVDEVEAALNAD